MKRAKIFATDLLNISSRYEVKVLCVDKIKIIDDITLIGEGEQDIFTKALQEIQTYIPKYSLEDLAILVKNCTRIVVGKYEFFVTNSPINYVEYAFGISKNNYSIEFVKY